MLYVNKDGTIQLTRGDTARLSVTIHNDLDDSDYDISENDTLRLTIRKNIKDLEPSMQKTITGSSQFHIEPVDTDDLAFGKYLYDVELTTQTGDVYTVIPPTTFELLKEVTY